MNNPWDFFKYIYVISLKEKQELRMQISNMLQKAGCNTFTIFDAVNGRKHPTLKNDYIIRGIISPNTSKTIGNVGCFVSHRSIWEKVYNTIDSHEPFWTLILEDDALLHPVINHQRLKEYLENIPSDARYIKFGHTCSKQNAYKDYKSTNTYWKDINGVLTYGTHSYAIRSDILSIFLNLKNVRVPVDCIRFHGGTYGATDPEDVYNLPKHEYVYENYITTQDIHGIMNVFYHQSTTNHDNIPHYFL